MQWNEDVIGFNKFKEMHLIKEIRSQKFANESFYGFFLVMLKRISDQKCDHVSLFTVTLQGHLKCSFEVTGRLKGAAESL